MFCLILICALLYTSAGESNHNFTYKCGNEDCTVPIGYGTAVSLFYRGFDAQIGLEIGDKLEILGVSNEANQLLVKVKNSEMRGYVPSKMVREERRDSKVKRIDVMRELPETCALKNMKLPPTTASTDVAELNVLNDSTKANSKLRIFLDIIYSISGNYSEERVIPLVNHSSGTDGPLVRTDDTVSRNLDVSNLSSSNETSSDDVTELKDVNKAVEWFDNGLKDEENEIKEVLDREILKKEPSITDESDNKNLNRSETMSEVDVTDKVRTAPKNINSSSVPNAVPPNNETDSSTALQSDDSKNDTSSSSKTPSDQKAEGDQSNNNGKNPSASMLSNDSKNETGSSSEAPSDQKVEDDQLNTGKKPSEFVPSNDSKNDTSSSSKTPSDQKAKGDQSNNNGKNPSASMLSNDSKNETGSSSKAPSDEKVEGERANTGKKLLASLPSNDSKSETISINGTSITHEGDVAANSSEKSSSRMPADGPTGATLGSDSSNDLLTPNAAGNETDNKPEPATGAEHYTTANISSSGDENGTLSFPEKLRSEPEKKVVDSSTNGTDGIKNKVVHSGGEESNDTNTTSATSKSSSTRNLSKANSYRQPENFTGDSSVNSSPPAKTVENEKIPGLPLPVTPGEAGVTASTKIDYGSVEHTEKLEEQPLSSNITSAIEPKNSTIDPSINASESTKPVINPNSSPFSHSNMNVKPELKKPQGFPGQSADRLQPEVNLSNEKPKSEYDPQMPDAAPPDDEPYFEGTVELQTPPYNDKHREHLFGIANPDKPNRIPSAPVAEKAFYEIALEYVPDVMSVFQNQLSRVIDSNFWTWKSDDEKGFCSPEQDCDGVIVHPMEDVDVGFSSWIIHIPGWGEVTSAEKEWLITYVGVFSLSAFIATVLLFIFNNAQNQKRAKALIGMVNRLENKLLVATKEIVSLEDQLTVAKPQQAAQTISTERERAIKEAFKKQMQQLQQRNKKLEDDVTFLQKELDEMSERALKMHELFENSLTTQSSLKVAMDEVEELRLQTEQQENEIEDLRQKMDLIIIENQSLKENTDGAEASLKNLKKEYALQNDRILELSEKQKDLTLLLDKEMENNSTLENNYKAEIYQLRSKLEDMEMDLKRSEFQVVELNRAFVEKQEESKTPEEARMLCDEVQLKMQLNTLEKMNNEITALLKEEKSARRMLEEHVGDVTKELNNVKKSFQVTEKERNEAVIKLRVLNEHFKEEKDRLQKDLEEQEKLFADSKNNDHLLSQKIASLKEEIDNYKLQNEALKKEIIDQEGSFKKQLANSEQNRDKHWFAYRQAQRKYEECQKEAGTLRNRIRVLETNFSGMSQLAGDAGNAAVNGDPVASLSPMIYPPMPPEMLPYSTPGELGPPPPPSPIASHSPELLPPEPIFSYLPDERLPPLGGRRVPSPPTSLLADDDEFAPPPPPAIKYLPGRSRNEPPIPPSYMRTPPPSNRHRFKHRQQRNSMDSPSSGVSMESLDKSGR